MAANILTNPALDPISRARIVCNCHKVSEEAVKQAIAEGAVSVEALSQQTRAGTGCGSCRTELAQLVRLHAKKAPLAATG